MRNESTGPVSGHSFQIGKVHGDIHLYGTSGQGEPAGPAEPEPEAETPKLPVRYIIAGILLVIVIILIANACGGGPDDPAFPDTDQGTRPSDVTDDAVTRLVAERLQRCAAAAVLTPSNCPQTHKANSPSNVHWDLVGDPRDGMQVRWNNNRLMARGTAVMTVSYESVGRPQFAIERIHFWTEIQWRGTDTRVDSIRQAKSAPPPGTIRKQRFTLPEDDLTNAVRDGFEACVSATSSPMPPTCPNTSNTPRRENVSWSLDGNPVGDWATHRDDTEFGLLRVTASYSLRLQYTGNGIMEGDHNRTYGGNYEATLVRTADNKARLLEIRQVTS